MVYCTEKFEEEGGFYQYQESFYKANKDSEASVKKNVNKVISSELEFHSVKSVLIEGDSPEITFIMNVGIVTPEFPFNE